MMSSQNVCQQLNLPRGFAQDQPSDLNLLAVAVTGRSQHYAEAEAEMDSAKRIAADIMVDHDIGPSPAARVMSLSEFLAFSSFFADLPVSQVVETLDAYLEACKRARGRIPRSEIQLLQTLDPNQADS